MKKPRVDRRGFLRASAAGAGSVLASARTYARAPGANDRVRVGMIGIGLIGKRHLLDFLAQPDVDVAGICELDESRLEEGVAACEGRPERFTDFRKMLGRKDIDAVVVSTPDHWHALLTILACSAGKDVYVEKPLTHAVCEGRWMIDTAAHHKRVVQVGTQQRSGVQYKRCVELIRGGHIGEVRHVRIASHRNIMPGFTQPVGTRPFSSEAWSMWLGPAPFVPYEPQRCLYHFRWFWDYSGGQTTNLLAHSIDIVQWAMDALPNSVAAVGGRYSLKGIGETPDVFEAIYEYPGFVVNWSSREMSAGRTGRGGGLEFCGTRGMLVVNRQGLEVIPDSARAPEDQIPRFTGPRRRPAGEDAAAAEPGRAGRAEAIKEEGYEEIRDQFQPHVRNFIDCVKSRQKPASDLLGAHQSSTSCHLANIAMKVGRRLRWDAAREAVVDDAEATRLLTKAYRSPWDRELAAALPRPATAERRD